MDLELDGLAQRGCTLIGFQAERSLYRKRRGGLYAAVAFSDPAEWQWNAAH